MKLFFSIIMRTSYNLYPKITPILSITLSAALVIIGALSVVFGIWISFEYRMPVPFRDMLEVMEFLDTNPSLWRGDHFTEFQSMQHRPVLPVFVWHLDRFATGANGFLPLALSHVALFTTAIIMAVQWAPRPSLNRIETWIIPIAAAALMFSLSNWINLMWEMQLHLSLSYLFIVASAYFGAKVWRPGEVASNNFDQKYLMLATAAGACAVFSFGYGLVILPVLLVHALLSGWPAKASFHIGVAVLGLLLVYFILLPSQGAPEAKLSLQFPPVTALFRYVSTV